MSGVGINLFSVNTLAAVAMWVALHESGVDPLITGLAVGLAISAYPPAREDLERVTELTRSFRKQPIFTLVAILTLTLGIGANTAIFSLLYQVLLRPLPFADPERLVFIWNTYPRMGLSKASVSIPDYMDRKTKTIH